MPRFQPSMTLIVATALALAGGLGYMAYRTSRIPESLPPPPAKTVAQPVPPEARFVGQQNCVGCHEQEHQLWMGSHHQLAMLEANEESVLGDFKDVTFEWYGVISRFYREGGKYMVHTEGPGGAMADFEVKYTFGVTPLQQYLIPFPKGRYQVLPLCWDSRPAEAGGQRWFHIYQDEPIRHDDPLHWTGPMQNWNFMCAECHSTELKKNYDLATDSFNTTWEEINVSCEACHGPGSTHVTWAERHEAGKDTKGFDHMGLTVRLKESVPGYWGYTDDSGTAKRNKPHDAEDLITTCARCHARRSVLRKDYIHGQSFMDTHLPSLLTENLYHPDGQIQDEVYVYGSFLQSKMYHAGVRCTDCHNPHSVKVIAPGNAVCAKCHMPNKYDAPDHHFHKADGEGASCIKCHMPTQNYMVVDPRQDHSIRVPRPDLSIKLGSPNACNQCHTDQTPAWADAAMDKWYGTARKDTKDYGEIIQGGRTGAESAGEELARYANDTTQPGIRRGTALNMLERYPSQTAAESIQLGLQDPDPLVRIGAAQALAAIPERYRMPVGQAALTDPERGVRTEAARELASLPSNLLSGSQQAELDNAIAEYIDVQMANADRAGSHMNLGLLYMNQGKPKRAEAAYRTALRIDPGFYQAYINLADFYRVQQQDAEAESLLLKAIEIMPRQAEGYHALGLLKVRQKKNLEAVAEFAKAAELAPNDARINYVYAIALYSTGKPQEAIQHLEKVVAQHPRDAEILTALASYHRDQGNPEAAIKYAQKLVEYFPQQPGYRQLLFELQQGRVQGP